MSETLRRIRHEKYRHEAELAEVRKELDQTKNALRGLYGLLKLIYVGADDVAEIKRQFATNHRAHEAARVLGVTPIGDEQEPPPKKPPYPFCRHPAKCINGRCEAEFCCND